MIQERDGWSVAGYPVLFGWLVGLVVVLAAIAAGVIDLQLWPQATQIGAILVVVLIGALGLSGLTVVNPNEARVLVLFGQYAGSLKTQGFWWVNPFTRRLRISLKIRNFESQRLKVNDHDGNPIEVAAVVVWRVVDAAEALFEVDDYEQFLRNPDRGRHPDDGDRVRL